MAQPPKRGLGRGLSALMSDVQVDQAEDRPRTADRKVATDRIVPNPDQPRRRFDDDALQELAASIREKGIIQPLIVRTSPRNGADFEIVAGERRWRAAQIAQVHEVPVIVREFDDTEVLEIAIIENIQRSDLNPVDEAAGYRQLMDRFGHTQDQMAKALGKSRSHIANLLRLLNLPEEVQTWLAEGKLSAGHARAFVGHPDATKLAQHVIAKNLSVREAEKLARQDDRPRRGRASSGGGTTKDADTIQIERELSATIGMNVSIDHGPGGESGTLTVSYKSLEQLDDLMRRLGGD